MSNTNQGLKSVAVKKLQELHGYNELPFTDSKSLLRTVTQVLTEPMFALQICAALIYLVIGGVADTILLSGFLALSIGITIYQERKSERAIHALKDLSSPRALVKRDGETKRTSSREVVVGDILILEEGDRIAVDATILTSNDLLVVTRGGNAFRFCETALNLQN